MTQTDKHICSGCANLRETVNGKYCLRLRVLVEYSLRKPCESSPPLFDEL